MHPALAAGGDQPHRQLRPQARRAPGDPRRVRGDHTNVPGISLCDPLPMLAQHQDKYSILRSLNPKNGSHGVADAYMLTGHPFNQAITYPTYGAVRRAGAGRPAACPRTCSSAIDRPEVRRRGRRVPGRPVQPVRPARRCVEPEFHGPRRRLARRRRPRPLPASDEGPRRPSTPGRQRVERPRRSLQAADTFYEKAYNLITAPQAKKAFDIHSEDPRLRDRYGRNSLGQGCLLARRLIEAGVRFVTVTDGGWDTHQNNFISLKTRLLPRLDAAVSGLLQDLSDRGMLDSTLVVVLSDFGRTPKINPSAGRDHWSTAGVALLAGGGLRPGIAVGQTNALAEQPTEAPYYTEDLAATIYHRLGIPLDTTHHTPDGRPIQVNYDGRVIRELV